ncbi:sugar phosphate isomerase/epimerase family protein [Lacticaseibacillus absianus]|uniref:sugar phosphate isomerase/epimerase family protein n=1 Tax=Lacticaseibacillus absianus TaxID=2729623 RepID=UPI0015C8C61F|nr:sugar phosphate isomerase/epimerase [Lacticaseibacillus absianus]
MKSALQLWSVQDAMKTDLLGTVEAVAQMGYAGVEFAGYFGVSAQALRQQLVASGLQVCGSHLALAQIQDHFDETLRYEDTIGNHLLVVPYLPVESATAWQRTCEEMEALARRVRAAGFQLAYHNHYHEFLSIPGQDLLDELYQAAPSLEFEADLYWLAYSGVDIDAWVQAHRQRLVMFHMKDMAVVNGERESVVLGTGTLPLVHYVDLARQLGHTWSVVEQEAFTYQPPMVAAAQDATCLNRLLQSGEARL